MKSLLCLEKLISAVNGSLIGNPSECFFTSVQTDSRLVEKDTLFVPLIGEFQDGHKYIPQALEKGASVIFVNKQIYNKSIDEYKKLSDENKDVVFILVENNLHALQDAAEAYVNQFPDLIKISITGSCGKTTTKEMLVSIFKAKYGEKVIYTKGNFNSETGLPLSVFNIRDNHKIGIFEMGMNRENEIGEISKVLKSRYGIITNIGTAHIGILGSRENIAKEKRKSFNYIPEQGAVFVPLKDDFADFCVENVKGKIVKFDKSVDEKVSGVRFIKDNGLKGMVFAVDGLEINLPLSGEHNYLNALGVIALAKECKIENKFIKQGFEQIGKLSGRMEVLDVQLKTGCKVTLVKDCYNANPDSMEKVISFVSSVKNVGKKIFVLADMLELGEKSKDAHSFIGKTLLQNDFDFSFLIGKEMKNAKDVLVKNNCSKFEYLERNDDESFSFVQKKLLSECQNNDVIVFKGSHSMALEKIIPEIVCNE